MGHLVLTLPTMLVGLCSDAHLQQGQSELAPWEVCGNSLAHISGLTAQCFP